MCLFLKAPSCWTGSAFGQILWQKHCEVWWMYGSADRFGPSVSMAAHWTGLRHVVKHVREWWTCTGGALIHALHYFFSTEVQSSFMKRKTCKITNGFYTWLARLHLQAQRVLRQKGSMRVELFPGDLCFSLLSTPFCWDTVVLLAQSRKSSKSGNFSAKLCPVLTLNVPWHCSV